MKILVSYRGIPQSPGWATGDFVVSAFQALGYRAIPYGNYYQTNRRINDFDNNELMEQEYDLYLQMECGDGDRQYTELAYVKAKKRATWWFDVALYPDRWYRETNAIGSNVNFVANKNFVNSNPHYVYLPYAADAKHIRRGTPKDIDFLIIGSDRPERKKLYETVCSVAPTANAQYITNAFREEYVDYLSRSHFVINDIAGGGQGLIPMRPFEVIAAGSHLITPYSDGVLDLGIPCLEYRNEEEFALLIKEMNDRPRPIRFGFQEKFLQEHTYINRCKKILDATL